ncbi:MAG: septum formation protein [Gammaproteobacteria bacterium]
MALLYLASKSPRRLALLRELGVKFETLAVDTDEIWDGKESARDYVTRLAIGKARAAKIMAENDWPILASDTEVVLDNQILGKPDNTEHAISILMSLSGRTHEVYTSLALVHETEQVSISVNQVSFKALTEDECRAYCDTGEPYDKAGAYGIQGRAAAFICKLEGSYSSVMGLPLSETAKLLKSI